MMYDMFSLFSIQVLKKLYLMVLEFWLFSSLDILQCFLSWHFKYERTHLSTYLQIYIYLYEFKVYCGVAKI